MTARNIFSEIKECVESFIEFQDGKKTLKTHKISLNKKPELSAQELIAIRVKLNVSQAIMADLICGNHQRNCSRPRRHQYPRSVIRYLAYGVTIDYAEDDRDILTAIGLRPDRASRADNQVKYSTEQSLIFLHRQAELN